MIFIIISSIHLGFLLPGTAVVYFRDYVCVLLNILFNRIFRTSRQSVYFIDFCGSSGWTIFSFLSISNERTRYHSVKKKSIGRNFCKREMNRGISICELLRIKCALLPFTKQCPAPFSCMQLGDAN